MTSNRMIELLEIEHECMLRNSHGDCDRNCTDCELAQDDDELHEMYTNVIALLKEQEPRELTKEEWEQWKKDERRDPICMVWYGDTTPFWVLRTESINEPLYLIRKIKLFTKKPTKEQVKWE